MNSRKKSILIYLGGIITGIILTFAFFFFVALGNTNGTPSDNNVVMFEKRKHSVNHVFSSPTSIINFTSKKPSYDDTRRSGRDNELLQRAQNDL